jgi:hypothetical protein
MSSSKPLPRRRKFDRSVVGAEDGTADAVLQCIVQSPRHRGCCFADGDDVNGFFCVELNVTDSYLSSTNDDCLSSQFLCVNAAQGSVEDIDSGETKMTKLNFGHGGKALTVKIINPQITQITPILLKSSSVAQSLRKNLCNPRDRVMAFKANQTLVTTYSHAADVCNLLKTQAHQKLSLLTRNFSTDFSTAQVEFFAKVFRKK